MKEEDWGGEMKERKRKRRRRKEGSMRGCDAEERKKSRKSEIQRVEMGTGEDAARMNKREPWKREIEERKQRYGTKRKRREGKCSKGVKPTAEE